MQNEMIERSPMVVTKMPIGRRVGMCASDTPELGRKAIGDFLQSGLSLGQKVALVASKNVEAELEIFAKEGFDFREDVESGQLNYIFHSEDGDPNSVAGNFSFPLCEIRLLCDLDVTRVGILDVDSLLYGYDLEKNPANIARFFQPSFSLPFAVFAQFTVKPTLISKRLVKEIRKVSDSFVYFSEECADVG